MLVKCPTCNTEYDCGPGKYQCACGVKFMLKPDGGVFVVSETCDNDRDNMSFPGRMPSGAENYDMTIPMPGLRERKTPGSFNAGEMILGRYMTLSELGQGGMGMVCKCFDETAGVVVALKSLPPDLSQYSQEMDAVKDLLFKLVCSLRHPNIACCNALERDNATGRYYLIMECVEGEDLRRWIGRMRGEGGLTLENVLPVIRQIAAALDYAHGKKISFCDLRPDSIMIDQDGHVKALAFGFAAQLCAYLSRVGIAYQGTDDAAPSMAPEQWSGSQPGPAADQYALAVMAYEMLAGHLPFDGADAESLRQAVLTRNPAPIPSLTGLAQAAIDRALSKDPAKRFRTCSDFIDALEGKPAAPPVVSLRGPQKNISTVTGTVPPPPPDHMVAPDRRIASEPPRRKPPEKKRGRKRTAAWLFFVLIAVAVFALFAYFKRNGFHNLSGFDFGIGFGQNFEEEPSDFDIDFGIGRASDKELSGGASASNQIPDERKTIALSNGVNLELMKVEAGTFEMSKKDGENTSDEVPHQVTLTKDFYIGRTEVTQAQWKAVMGNNNNPSEFKGDDLPVEKVSWNDAMTFCEKLNTTGKAPNGWKFTLPTETQWEYAARGGNKSKGYKFSGSNNADEVAWYCVNSGDSRQSDSSYTEDELKRKHCKTHPVGQKNANELGLYDMSGNVFEWCLDDWQDRSNRLTAEFLRGNERSSQNRVAKGGRWGSPGSGCRSARRNAASPDTRIGHLGFRVALVPAAGYGAANAAKPIPLGDKTIALSNGAKLELMKVEAGTFEMSKKDGENVSSEVPHQVTLMKDFYLGQTEVTQAQWKAVMGNNNNPSEFKGDDLPMERVTWNEAMSFCEKLNSTGKAPAGWKFTLPTETQWEYAARGGNKSKGYKYSGSNNVDEVAWFTNNSGSKTHPVGQKNVNELGLCDMSGNVWEWCLDDWNEDSSRQIAEFSRGNDQGGSPRVRRGGSFQAFNSAGDCRSAHRNNFSPARRYNDIGFRVVLVPTEASAQADTKKQASEATPRTGSLVVTTVSDVVNANDKVNSLREALSYAITLGGQQTISFNMPDGDKVTISDPALLNRNITFLPTNTATSNTVTIVLDNLSVSDRNRNGTGGGAFMLFNDVNIVVSGGTYSNNRDNGASGTGGAFKFQKCNVTIENATFKNNYAYSVGGAIAGEVSSFTVRNSVFDGNNAVGYAGAFDLINSDAWFTDTTFINNRTRSNSGYGWCGGALSGIQNHFVYEVTAGKTITNVGNDSGIGGFLIMNGEKDGNASAEFRINGILNIGNGDGKDSIESKEFNPGRDVYLKKTGSGTMTINAPTSKYDDRWIIEDGVISFAYAKGGDFDGDITISGGQMQLGAKYTFKNLTFQLPDKVNDTAFVSDLANLTGGAFTVNADKAVAGVFKLAGNAGDFNSAISLVFKGNIYKDVLTVGKNYRLDGAEYSLRINSNNELTLTIRGNKKTVSFDSIKLPGGAELKLVKVEAGTFTMGVNDGENRSNEKPHTVTLKHDFYIGQTEVTQAQWKAVMNTNPSKSKGDNLPVEMVSWVDAQAFCQKLNELLAGKLPAGYHFDLPTEAQSEYAARGGNKSRGYKYSGSNDPQAVAWIYLNSGHLTHPVGTKQANELGLYDMTGNVSEWCRDWFESGYAKDPEFLKGNQGSERLRHGGGCRDTLDRSWLSYRGSRPPDYSSDNLGFRVALVPESY